MNEQNDDQLIEQALKGDRAAFGTLLWTDPDNADDRIRSVNAGAQLDMRVMLFSYLKTTLSVGWARARTDGRTSDKGMISLKIL